MNAKLKTSLITVLLLISLLMLCASVGIFSFKHISHAATAEYVFEFKEGEDHSFLSMDGGWQVNTQSGVLERKTGGGDGFVWFKDYAKTEATFSFKLKITGQTDGANGDYALSMVMNNTDAGNWQTSNRICLRTPLWNVASSGNFAEGYSGFGSVLEGTTIGGFSGFTENQTYEVKAVYLGQRAQFSVDGKIVLDCLFPQSEAGRVGLNSWNLYCEIDDLTLKDAEESDFLVPATEYDFEGKDNLAYLDMTAAGGFKVEDGVLKRTDGEGDGRVWFNGTLWKNVYAEFDLSLSGKIGGIENYAFSFITRSASTGNTDWQNSIRFALTPIDSSYRPYEKAIAIETKLGEVQNPAAEHAGLALNQKYRVKAIIYETKALLYLDDVLLLNATVPEGAAGRFGFNSWGVACEIDNLSFRQALNSDIPSEQTNFTMDGGWKQEGEALIRDTGSGDGFVWTDKTFQNAKVSFSLKPTGTSAENKDYCLWIVARNTDTSQWMSSVYAGLRTKEWLNAGTGNFIEVYSNLGEVQNGADKVNPFSGFELNKDYEVTAVFYTNKAQISVDGELIIEATIPEGDAGRIGLCSFNMWCEVRNLSVSEASFDDLIPREPQGEAADENIFDFGAQCDVGALSVDGGWAVNTEAGVLERKTGTGDGFIWLNNSSSWTGAYFEFDFKPTGCASPDNKDYGLSLVSVNNNASNWQASNRVILRPVDWAMACNFVELYSGIGEVSDSVAADFAGFELNQNYHVKVVFYQNRVLVYIDGTLIMNVKAPEGKGRIGINSWNIYCEIDNLEISKATAEDVEEVPEIPTGQKKDRYEFDFSNKVAALTDLSMDNGWAVNEESGVLERKSGENDAFVWLKSRTDWTDTVFEFTVKFTGDSGTKNYSLSIVSRKTGGAWLNSNRITLRAPDWSPDNTAPINGNYVEAMNNFEGTENAVVNPIGAASFTGFEIGTQYTVKALAIGNRLLLYVDDKLVLDAASLMHTRGEIGLNSWNAYAEIDNLVMRVPTQEEIDATPPYVPEQSTGEGPIFSDPGKDTGWTSDNPELYGSKDNIITIMAFAALGAAVVGLGVGIVAVVMKKRG